MIGKCPDIGALEALAEADNKKVIKHAERCAACQAVLALVADRTADVETPECAEIELLATQLDQLSAVELEKVRGHTATCEACRLLLDDLP